MVGCCSGPDSNLQQNATKQSYKETRSKPMGFAPMITLLLFSTALLTIPLGVYFTIHHYLRLSTTFAAMGAIVAVQLIVAAYIYKAWQDETREHESQLKKEMKKRS